MMPRYINRHAAAAPGFTLVELMVVFAVIGIMLGVAVPNVQNWRRNYNVKSAVTDLYANMQLARLGAIKSNQPWTMTFLAGVPADYKVRDADGCLVKRVCLSSSSPCLPEPDAAGCPEKQLDLANKYHGNIVYGKPDNSPPIDNATITFRPSGMADNGDGVTAPGFVYLAGSKQSVYYRVGIRLTGSAARIQRWNGSAWR